MNWYVSLLIAGLQFVFLTRMSPCPLCGGSGKQDDLDCGLCHGTGEHDSKNNASNSASQQKAVGSCIESFGISLSMCGQWA
jgi:DnaJ-class molecular chaperone